MINLVVHKATRRLQSIKPLGFASLSTDISLYGAACAPSVQENSPNIGLPTVRHLHKIIWYTFRKEFLLTPQTDYDVQNFHFRKIISYPHSASTILTLIFKVHIEVLRHFQERLYESSYIIALVCFLFVILSKRSKVITLRSCKQLCSSAENNNET
jgi:hypothetical protein